MQNRANALWRDVRNNGSIVAATRNLYQHLIMLAEKTRSQILALYQQFNMTKLVPQIQKSLQFSQQHVIETLEKVRKASTAKDFADIVVQEITIATNSVQGFLSQSIESLNLTKLLPNSSHAHSD